VTFRFALRVLALAAASTLVAVGESARGQDETGPPLPFETVLTEARSGLAEPRREVIRSEEAWRELWARVFSGVTPTPPRPTIDFSREMLIVVALGERRSGGFGIAVQRVSPRADGLEIEVLESCPAPGAMVSMGLTQPLEVVRLEKQPQAPSFLQVKSPTCP